MTKTTGQGGEIPIQILKLEGLPPIDLCITTFITHVTAQQDVHHPSKNCPARSACSRTAGAFSCGSEAVRAQEYGACLRAKAAAMEGMDDPDLDPPLFNEAVTNAIVGVVCR